MCSLEVRLDGDGAIASMRGHEADPLSRGHICPKAFALQDVHEDPDRLRRPVRRTADGGWREVSWDEAIGFAASALAAVQREHGDDAVAVYQGNPNVHSLGALTHNPTLVRLLHTRNRFSATSVDQLPHQVVAWALYGHQFLLPVPGHRPHRPARARRPQPDGVERVALDGARLPPAAARARFSRRAVGRHRPAPHRDGQGRRRAPLRATRLRRSRAAGGRARAAGRRCRQPCGVRRRGRRGARGGRGLHARARRAGQRHARGCRARPRARPRRRALGRRPRADGCLDAGPRCGVPVGGAGDQPAHRQPRPARRHDADHPRGRPHRSGGASGPVASGSAARGCGGCRRSGESCRCRCSRRRSPRPGRARCAPC